MSNIFKSNNINIQSPYSIKNVSTELNLENIQSAIEDERLDLSEREELFNIQLEQQKSEMFARAQIEARVNANKVYEEIVNKAKIEAQQLLDNADRILKEAEQKAEIVTTNAYNEAYQKGIDETQDYINQSNAMLQSITDERKNVINNLKPEIIELIINLFEKVVGYKLSNDDEFMVKLLQNTLEQFGNKNAIVVKVSNEDFETIDGKKADILSKLRNIDGFTLLCQESLQKGDCIVETSSGEIDSSISTQLEHIKCIVEDVLKNDLDGEN